MSSLHFSRVRLRSIEDIRASQKNIKPVIADLDVAEVVDHLSARRAGLAEEQKKWDAFFDVTPPWALPITDPIKLSDLPSLVSPDAPTEYVPAIRRQNTDAIPTIPDGRRTEKHNLVPLAMRLALAETVKFFLQEYLDEHEKLPLQIRTRDSLAQQLLKAKLIYQGHVVFGGALIPLITDPSIEENTAYLVC